MPTLLLSISSSLPCHISVTLSSQGRLYHTEQKYYMKINLIQWFARCSVPSVHWCCRCDM